MSNGDPGEQPESSGCAGIMAILRAVETRRAGSVVAGLLGEGRPGSSSREAEKDPQESGQGTGEQSGGED